MFKCTLRSNQSTFRVHNAVEQEHTVRVHIAVEPVQSVYTLRSNTIAQLERTFWSNTSAQLERTLRRRHRRYNVGDAIFFRTNSAVPAGAELCIS